MFLFIRKMINTAEGPQAEGCGNGSWESVHKRQAEQRGLITAVRTGGNDVARLENHCCNNWCKTQWLRVMQ